MKNKYFHCIMVHVTIINKYHCSWCIHCFLKVYFQVQIRRFNSLLYMRKADLNLDKHIQTKLNWYYRIMEFTNRSQSYCTNWHFPSTASARFLNSVSTNLHFISLPGQTCNSYWIIKCILFQTTRWQSLL